MLSKLGIREVLLCLFLIAFTFAAAIMPDRINYAWIVVGICALCAILPYHDKSLNQMFSSLALLTVIIAIFGELFPSVTRIVLIIVGVISIVAGLAGLILGRIRPLQHPHQRSDRIL